MTEKELKEYKDFMVNPCNSHKCEGCPANEHTTQQTRGGGFNYENNHAKHI